MRCAAVLAGAAGTAWRGAASHRAHTHCGIQLLQQVTVHAGVCPTNGYLYTMRCHWRRARRRSLWT